MALSSALLLHSPISEDPLTSRGGSGVFITDKWILTHGSILAPLMEKNLPLSRFVTSLPPGKLTITPEEARNASKFLIYRDFENDDGSRSVRSAGIREHFGSATVAWKCSLLTRTFEEFFRTWSFPKSSRFDRLLRSIFLLVRVDRDESYSVEIPMIERSLSRVMNEALGNPVRGSLVEIESTPFGNPVFIDSIARGVVSNVIGDEGCIIMTDAQAFPGCEGGAVYVTPFNCKRRTISGLVIAPLSWCRGEWVDYTFAANLAPCLLDVLQRDPPRSSTAGCARSEIENDAIDRCVVLVRCGVSWGTGILVDENTATFLTCAHVVAEAPEREISIVTSSRYRPDSRVRAKLLYKTAENQPYDVAVLRANPKDVDPSLKSIRLSHATSLKGEPVMAAGFPFFSSTRPTISSGVVSKPIDCVLLTTCCTQSGTSGGPIVSQTTGEMLGMIVCNAMSSDGGVLYPRMSMSVPSTVLNGPLQEYLRTDNAAALRAFTCDETMVRRIWDFYHLVPSKM